jgi:hypothetical protein
MPPGGLSKLRPLDSRNRQPIRIVLLYVCWRVENGSDKDGTGMLSYDNDLPLPVLVPMKTSFPSAKALKLSIG